MHTRLGTISTLSGHPMSGLWTLHFADGRSVLIESGHGVRQLAHAFGAREGTGDLLEKIAGQEVVYSTDDLGLLAAFTPAAEWAGPEIPPEGIDLDGETDDWSPEDGDSWD
jgi:hypothetical protein